MEEADTMREDIGESLVSLKINQIVPKVFDWSALPSYILSAIFKRIFDPNRSLKDTVTAHQNLGLVCKHWMSSVRKTPITVCLSEPLHLGDAAAHWLQNTAIEFLTFKRRLFFHTGSPPLAIEAVSGLLSSDQFVANSKHTLTGIIKAPSFSIDTLKRFKNLKQFTYFEAANRPFFLHPSFVSICQALSKLECLSIVGTIRNYDNELTTALKHLPGTLKHLAVCVYTGASQNDVNDVEFLCVALPTAVKKLEYASFKADCVVFDWQEMIDKVEELHIGSKVIVSVVDTRHDEISGRLLVPDSNFFTSEADESTRLALYQAFAASLLAPSSSKHKTRHSTGAIDALSPDKVALDNRIDPDDEVARLEHCTLAFSRLAFSPSLGRDLSRPPETLVLAEMDDFLDVLKETILGRWDVDPALDIVPNLIEEGASSTPCFVMKLDKQDDVNIPRSYHFTTDVSDAEMKMMFEFPAWKISWCDDERAAEIINDPRFVAASGSVLRRLTRLPLSPAIDFTPFTALKTINGPIDPTVFDTVNSLRLPPSLVNLGLKVHRSQDIDVFAPKIHFDSSSIRHLPNLKELSLGGFNTMCFDNLPETVQNLKIVDPEPHDATDYYDNLTWRFRVPSRLRTGSNNYKVATTQTDSPTPSSVAKAMAATSLPADRNSATSMEIVGTSDEVLVDATAAAENEVNTAASSKADSVTDMMKKVLERRKRRWRHRHRYQDDSLDGSGASGVLSDADEELLAELEDEDENQHASNCDDPLCPIHSKKRHLQVAFSAHRRVKLDLRSLLESGFPMVTVTMCESFVGQVAGENSGFLSITSSVNWGRVLEEMVESELEVLEINVPDGSNANVSWDMAPGVGGLAAISLFEGLLKIQSDCGDIFSFKTWDGNDAVDGLKPGGKGYAVVRTSLLNAKKSNNDGINKEQQYGQNGGGHHHHNHRHEAAGHCC